MRDTSPEVEQKFRDLLLQRSGEERLKMGCSMHAAAQALVLEAANRAELEAKRTRNSVKVAER